jgi:hypothetical protein
LGQSRSSRRATTPSWLILRSTNRARKRS